MRDDEKINSQLDTCLQYVKQINHMNGIENDNLLIYKAIVFAGMVAYYGEKHLDDIYKAFLDTKFICVDGSLRNLLSSETSYNREFIDAVLSHAEGSLYNVISYRDDDSSSKMRFRREIYIEKDLLSRPYDVLDRLTHQMNHVINSQKNSVCSKQKRLAVRMGICLDYLDDRYNESIRLEEAFNDLQKQDILDEIIGFSFFEIKNPLFASILDSSVVEESKGEKSHQFGVEEIRPLYEQITFNSVLVERRLSGKLSGIRELFDSKTEKGAYNEFLDYFTLFAARPKSEENNSDEHVRQLVKTFVSNCD